MRVTGMGFLMGRYVTLSECASVNPDGCGPTGAGKPFITADEHGKVEGSFVVTTNAYTAACSASDLQAKPCHPPTQTRCADECVLFWTDGGVSGETPLRFASN